MALALIFLEKSFNIHQPILMRANLKMFNLSEEKYRDAQQFILSWGYA